MPSFIIKEGPQSGRRFEFRSDIEIGREAHGGLAIDDRTISRRHVGVAVRSDGVWVTDLKSQNGTAVNRRRIVLPTRLAPGDLLRLGSILLEFHADGFEESLAPIETTSVRLDDSRHAVVATVAAANAAATLAKDGETLSADALRKRLEVLHDVSVAFHLTLDEPALLSLILRKLLEVMSSADRGFIVLLEQDGETLRTGAVHFKSGISGEIAVSRTLVWDVIKNRRGIVSADARLDERLASIESIIGVGLRAILCVPMIADDEVQGVIALDSLTSSGAFGRHELALLVGIAAQAALSLAKARLHKKLLARELMERDLELAAKIQSRFLPHRGPEHLGWSFQAFYRAALEVGGDYYDFLDLPGDKVGVAIGDVSGKGISAALCMVRLSAEVKYQAAGAHDPADVLKAVNRVLYREFEDGMFVTSILLVIDTDTNELNVASAGHMPPLVRHADGTVVEVAITRTPPLGVTEGAVFRSSPFSLEAGDTVILYTDGISEATAAGGELFGMERLVDAIGRAEPTPKSVLASILTAVRDFTGGEEQSDDITLVCVGPTGDMSRVGPSTWEIDPETSGSLG